MKKMTTSHTSFIIAVIAFMLPRFAYMQSEETNSYRSTYDTTTTNKLHSAHHTYMDVYDELKSMLDGTEPLDFERAVFITENVYYQNRSDYSEFQKTLDMHTYRIIQLMAANNRSDTIDFKVYTNYKERGLDYTSWRFTEDEKRKLYYQTLANWAIFTYLTDTVMCGDEVHLPFSYRADDPFGLDNWGHSQVIHMLSSPERKGNCFAFAALFKIFSDRLYSEASLCTAPQHIYIQHRDIKGRWYNVELPTRSFPSDGIITTLTNTTRDGIMSGLSIRKLTEAKQNVVLCLVNLGKSYEHRFGSKESDFALQCAELALNYDSLNLNAWLLKHQVYQERVLHYIKENNVTALKSLHSLEAFKNLEQVTLFLYDKGYREMPRSMQEIILSKLKGDSLPSNLHDYTPTPFTTITVPESSRRYSTASGGLYDEMHERKDIEQYGYFLLDTKQRHLIFVDTMYINNPLIDPVVFAWGIDPLTFQYPSYSPYSFVNNSPIVNIDPDGKKIVWYVTAIMADGSVTKIKYVQDGTLKYQVKNTSADPELGKNYYEIYDTEYHVTIDYSKNPDGLIVSNETKNVMVATGWGGDTEANQEIRKIQYKEKDKGNWGGWEIYGGSSHGDDALTRKGKGDGKGGVDVSTLPGFGGAEPGFIVKKLIGIVQGFTKGAETVENVKKENGIDPDPPKYPKGYDTLIIYDPEIKGNETLVNPSQNGENSTKYTFKGAAGSTSSDTPYPVNQTESGNPK